MRIRFTMKMINSERGFLLIDVLIAAAIIGFFTLPVTASLLNSVAGASYARDVYKAVLYAGKLIYALETALNCDYAIISAFDGREAVFENFDTDYETDFYDYSIRISKYAQNGSIADIVMMTADGIGRNVRTATVRGMPYMLNPIGYDVSVESENTEIEIYGFNTSFIAGLNTQRERHLYILLVEVFDKKGRSLTCRAKPVFV